MTPSIRWSPAAALLFTDGDKMAADVQKFVDAAEKTDFAREAGALEAKVLLVRVANWRTLATRDAKGIATFKTNVGKAQQQIAELEKAASAGKSCGVAGARQGRRRQIFRGV